MHPLPHSPAADRNTQPILDVLRNVLPDRGSGLEISSGTGQHRSLNSRNDMPGRNTLMFVRICSCAIS